MTSETEMAMLKVSDVSVYRSGIPVVRQANLEVAAGQVVALLGVNGAGKSTLIEGISGLLPLGKGRLYFDGRDISSWSASRRARHGLAHVEEGRSVFPGLTVEENIRAALTKHADWERAFELFPELEKRRGVNAGSLSGGEQQMLVVARAWLRDPKVFLFDELSVGLAPNIVTRLLGTIRAIADEGKGVLLVEQFSGLALQIADRALVMRHGELVFDGPAEVLAADPALVQRLYLGSSDQEEAA